MSLFGLKEKREIERLQTLVPKTGQQILEYEDQLKQIKAEISNAKDELVKIGRQRNRVQEELNALKKDVVETREIILFQDFGLYEPHYSFANSDMYKKQLIAIRDAQKQAIKNGEAVTGNLAWQVNGSSVQGKKLVQSMQKLLLRAFNAECDDVIEHVKYNNIDAAQKRICKSAEAISKLGKIMSISVSQRYYNLKIQELYLAFEYQRKKEEEKEAQREARARMQEEKKLAEEIERERKKLEKEQSHYLNEVHRLSTQIEGATGEHKQELTDRYDKLTTRLNEISEEFKAVDYREANQKAGYVYIISNIGSFGENVYKIGMTRRLDPQDRVDELGSASVPFKFDVHAMIFSDNAPALEATLHKAFANKKVNLVNQRKEFFNVTLDEIKEVVYTNFDDTVEFVELPMAEQYRETLKLREQSDRNDVSSSALDKSPKLARTTVSTPFDYSLDF